MGTSSFGDGFGDSSCGPVLTLDDLNGSDYEISVFARISHLRGWLEEKMPGATTCSNGFDADKEVIQEQNVPRQLTSGGIPVDVCLVSI